MRNFWTEFSLAIRALVVIAITIAVCATTADTPLPPPAKVSVIESKPALPRRLGPESWHPSRGREATQSALVFPHWYRQFIRR